MLWFDLLFNFWIYFIAFNHWRISEQLHIIDHLVLDDMND